LFVAAIPEFIPTGSRSFFNKLFLVFVTTRALHFHRQENFLVEIENKIHFFLVAFTTDFYSQARWRGRPQSVCE